METTNIYKQATQEGLRIKTKRGEATVEQLWDLPLSELDEIAVALEEKAEKSGKKSFLTTRSAKDNTIKLQFDIVFDVITTKVEADKVARVAKDKREQKKKLLELIANKEDQTLQGKSKEELEKMLAELDA